MDLIQSHTQKIENGIVFTSNKNADFLIIIFCFANLSLDDFLNILECLYVLFACHRIGNFFSSLNNFLVKHCLFFPHRHLTRTKFYSDTRKF